MNTETADLTTAAAPVAVSGNIGTGTTLVTLVRREFWEHTALWRVPLIAAVLLALCAVPAHVGIDADDWAGVEQNRVAIFTATQLLCVPLYLVMLIVLTFYLLDCLYAERKDRSILFWKSLPVSDGLTVLSKFLVAVAVVPLGVFVLGLLSHLAFVAIWQLRVAAGHAPALISWDTLAWLRTTLVFFLCLVLGALWYAPVAAALLLVSAWARRAPMMWATLPLIFAPILERIAFGTHYLGSFLRYRTNGIWQLLAQGGPPMVSGHHARGVDTLLSTLNFGRAFTSVDLWLGVAAAAALLYVTIRVRRYRDDT
jgi:ABC-2 type transport system permease protein